MENKEVKKQSRKTKGTKGKIAPLHTKRKDAEKLTPTVGAGLPKPKRKTGIGILGDASWGTHFCLFYHTRQDLIDILVPYFKAGLENNEFCMWVTSEPLNAEDAEKSLSQAVTNLDDYIKKGQIEILDYTDWYTKSGAFEADRVLDGWVQKHNQAIKNDFDGLRLTGNTLWLEKKDWKKFVDYEAAVNGVIGKYKILAICTYWLDKCGASEIIDVVSNHQFALIRQEGEWKVVESSEHKRAEEALRESEKKYRTIIESSHEVIFGKDRDGHYHTLNLHAAIGLGGTCIKDIEGKTDYELLPKEQADALRKVDEQIMKSGRDIEVEEVVRNAQGKNRIYLSHKWPLYDNKGRINGISCFAMDITERKRVEERLVHLNAVLRAIHNVNQLIAKEKDHKRLLQGICDNLTETRGYRSAWIAILNKSGWLRAAAEAGLGEDFSPIIERLKRGPLTECSRRALSQPGVVVTEAPPFTCADHSLSDKYRGGGEMTTRLECSRKVYGLLSVSVPAHLTTDEKEQTLFEEIAGDIAFALHDIELDEERKQAEQKILASREKLRHLTSELCIAEERERRRLAAGVHDNVGQNLALAKLTLQSLMESASGSNMSAPLDEVCAVIEKTIQDVHSLTFELSNPVLHELGFEAAVEQWLTEQVQEKYGIKYKFTADLQPLQLDNEISIILFQAVRELLVNVVKHAKANTVGVRIQKAGDRVQVAVEDDGVGFLLSKLHSSLSQNKRGGFGLFSIQERLEYLSGDINIKSAPEQGTSVYLTVPLKR